MGQAIGALILACGMMATSLAFLPLVAPRWSGAGHRIYALPLLFAFVGAAGTVALILPASLDDKDIAGTRLSGAFMLLIWALTIGLAMVLAKRSDNPLSRQGFWKGLGSRWISGGLEHQYYRERREARAALKAGITRDKKNARLGLAGEELESRTGINAIEHHEVIKFRRQVAAEKLLAEHERAMIKAEQEGRDTQRRIDTLSVIERPRRKGRLTDEDYQASISREGFEPSGKWANFEYVDVDGVVTDRNIVSWKRQRGYIIGFDLDRKAERTFRQDRISQWVAG